MRVYLSYLQDIHSYVNKKIQLFEFDNFKELSYPKLCGLASGKPCHIDR